MRSVCFCGSDRSCSVHTTNSEEWLQRNLGGFSFLASLHDLQMLYSNFSAVRPVALCLLLLCLFICLFLFFCLCSCTYMCLCAHADGSLTTSDGQTASRGVRHTWPAHLSRSGYHGDEAHPQPTPARLLWRLLACHHGEWNTSFQIVSSFCPFLAPGNNILVKWCLSTYLR